MDETLAHRYADPKMADIWSDRGRWVAERTLWHTILCEQSRLGIIGVTRDELHAYRVAIQPEPNTAQTIAVLESVTRHDLQARLMAYEQQAALRAGGPPSNKLHWGLTSADITENTYCILIKDSLAVINGQLSVVLQSLASIALNQANLATVGRTHGQPAQLTTIGARFARWHSELQVADKKIRRLHSDPPFRGIRGAVGTSQDLITLSDRHKVRALDTAVAAGFGFVPRERPTGQVGYRSLDFDIASALLQVCAAPASLAVTLRQMQMLGLSFEPFTDGQVGSSAMAHKRNPRYLERIEGLQNIARGYHLMIELTAGNTWFEGDVSDSCVRRVAWPGLFLAVSGLLRTLGYILGGLTFDALKIGGEVTDNEIPLSTGMILATAVKMGADRQQAHAAIREAAQTRGLDVGIRYLRALAADERIPLDEGQIAGLILQGTEHTGFAYRQAVEPIQSHPQSAGQSQLGDVL